MYSRNHYGVLCLRRHHDGNYTPIFKLTRRLFLFTAYTHFLSCGAPFKVLVTSHFIHFDTYVQSQVQFTEISMAECVDCVAVCCAGCCEYLNIVFLDDLCSLLVLTNSVQVLHVRRVRHSGQYLVWAREFRHYLVHDDCSV